MEIFRTLSKSEWGSVIPTKKSAKSAIKKDQKFLNDPRMHARPTELVTTPYIKNAAFYVDVEKENILVPSRVDRYANDEIQGLTWSLEHTSSLMQILSDEKKWMLFADSVRQTPGAHLSIEKDVLTPKKKALRIIDKLPDTATWDHIQKKIKAAAKAADMAPGDQLIAE